MYSIITQMYIRVVVKVGFFVVDVGRGSLTSERDTPVYQEERTLYVYDPFTLSAYFSLCEATRVSFFLSVFHTMYSTLTCPRIVQNNVFLIENIEDYIKQKDKLNL